jgi:hypothetical protein
MLERQPVRTVSGCEQSLQLCAFEEFGYISELPPMEPN